jgi:type IV pilus modification protein PilV
MKFSAMNCSSRQSGFSMIDVLVAIIVLATGLLALAVLQGAITRNGVDARARSQVAAFTESVVDRMRSSGYDTVSPSTSIATGTVITPLTACTGTLTLVQRMGCDADVAQTAAGVSNLKTTISGVQYYGTGSGNSFGTTPSASGTAAYKVVTATTQWTDASGQPRSLDYSTTVDKVSTSPTDNSLAGQSFKITLGSAPKVREANPGDTAGVIPIAVSSSQNAAATNPAPLVSNTGTTFSTITYNATSDPLGGNQITQRIDTKVMRCTCKYKADGGVVSTDSSLITLLTQPYGPTYWDGTKYVVPTKLTSNSATTGVDSSATQDTDCDICCRDRNDVAGNAVLFDNYSGGDFSKYQYDNSGVLAAVSSGSYPQTCRMIRVDGTYAAATDIRNYFFGMLDTESCSTATAANSPKDPVTGNTCTSATAETSAVPTSTASTNYKAFVTTYLFNSMSSLSAGTGPYVDSTSPQGTDAAADLYNTTNGLNAPTSITLATSNDTRFLHARGLYIDHLETKAQQALANAVSNCSGTAEEDLVNCGVYAVLPFTTVNMTELAFWTADAPNLITTPVNASVGGVGYNPTRGYVYASSTTANGTVDAVATVNQLNSGLTGVTDKAATTATEAALKLLDQKQFVLNGSGGSSGGGNAVYFDVLLSNLSWLSTSNLSLDPSVAWSGTAAQLGTAVSTTNMVSFLNSGAVNYAGNVAQTGCNKQGNNCTTTYYPGAATPSSPVTAPVGLTVTVQGYNYCAGKKLNSSGVRVDCPLASTGSGSENLTCSGVGGGSYSSNKATQCYNYSVDYGGIKIGTGNAGVTAADVSLLSGTTEGGQSEGAVITIPNSPGVSSSTNTTAGADLITIPFTSPAITIAPGTCSCSKSGGCNANQVTYTPGACSN